MQAVVALQPPFFPCHCLDTAEAARTTKHLHTLEKIAALVPLNMPLRGVARSCSERDAVLQQDQHPDDLCAIGHCSTASQLGCNSNIPAGETTYSCYSTEVRAQAYGS